MPSSCLSFFSSTVSCYMVQSTYLILTADEIRDMSDDDLLDMDYFLHEFDDLDDDDFGEEGFYIF